MRWCHSLLFQWGWLFVDNMTTIDIIVSLLDKAASTVDISQNTFSQSCCGLMVHLAFSCLLLVLTNQLGLFASSIIRDTTSRISYWFSFKGINQSSDPEILVCQKMPHFDLNQDWSLSLNHYWRRKVKSSMIDFHISVFFLSKPADADLVICVVISLWIHLFRFQFWNRMLRLHQ